MNSHIQVPKCVLKNFSNEKKSLYYYDVKKECIKIGSAKTLNTSEGYYSKKVEDILSAEIESPLGQLIALLQKVYKVLRNTNKIYLEITYQHHQIIKNYLYALLFRSPQMAGKVAQDFIFRNFFSKQYIHDFTFVDGYEIARDEAFLNHYNITFIFCDDSAEFMLSMSGYCSFVNGDIECIVIPLTKKIAIYMYKSQSVLNAVLRVGQGYVDEVNKITFIQQTKRSQGFIVASNKQYIEKIKTAIRSK